MTATTNPPVPPFGGTFESLRAHYNYRLYFVGQIVSYTGSFMQDTALPWLVLSRTNSPLLVGLLVFCRYGPFSVFGLYGGFVADRFDNRHVLLVSQVTQMAAALVLTIAVFADAAPLWLIYSMTLISGITLAFDNPSKYALIYRLVGRNELPNAVALSISLQNAARVVGPAIGGVLIAAVGIAWCLTVNTLSFIAVIAGLLLMRVNELLDDREGLRDVTQSPFRAVREGLAYARRSRELQVLMGVALTFGLFGFSAIRTLLSVLAGKTLHSGAQTFGALFAAYGGGAVLGGLVSATFGRASWRRLFLGATVFSGGILALAPLKAAIPCAIILVVVGGAWTTWSTVAQSIAVLAAPSHLRGRVISLYNSALLTGVPFGALLGGWLASVGGTPLAFGVAGAAGLAATAVAGLSLRRHTEPAVEYA